MVKLFRKKKKKKIVQANGRIQRHLVTWNGVTGKTLKTHIMNGINEQRRRVTFD